MKKGIKMMAVGGMLAAGLLLSNNVKAVSELNYNLNLYKKYVVLTDEGKVAIPASYHFDNGTKDGYDLNLTKLRTNLNNISNTYPDYTTYNTSTGEFTSKYGIELTYNGTFDVMLLKPNGKLNEDLNNATTKNSLERIAIVSLLRDSKRKNITQLQSKLDAATTDKERTSWSTQIQNYNEDLAAWENININDLPNNKKGYNFVTTARCVASTASRYNSTSGAHIGDNITLSYYYYTVLIRDLRLNGINYRVNGGEETAVLHFDKDTKTYNVQLPVNTPKNARITTSSKSYALEEDADRNWEYDSGITVQDSTITLNNGVGTAKVKVKFDATPYGDNGTYEKEYTVNFTTLAYQKGDVNKDTYVNATDAAIVLDLFKNQNATQENYDYGDMNNDKVLNSTDAAMILDIYKSSNQVVTGGGIS